MPKPPVTNAAPSSAPLTLFAASAPGLEPMLVEELRGLGFIDSQLVMSPGGVEIKGDLATLYRLNLELGLSLKVLLRLGEFPARRFDGLVKRVAELPWENWCTRAVPLEVRATCKHSKLYHSGAVIERVVLGIEERLGRGVLLAPDANTEGALPVHARIVNDVCTISIDTSGELLHRRGYRKATAKAPLREDLARALIIASGWDRKHALCDPMCGAGTIAIEADWLARRVPPGHMREFAFMQAPCFDSALWERVRERALARVQPRGPAIFASDRDRGAVAAAEANAERAGAAAVHIAEASLSSAPCFVTPPNDGLFVVTNPPYGKRIGHDDSVARLYRALGDRLRALPYRVALAMTVAQPEHAYATRVPLRPLLMTDHGGSKIYFSVYDPARAELSAAAPPA